MLVFLLVCHTCVEGIPVFWELNEALVVLVQVFLLHFLFPQKHVQFSKVLEQKAEMKVRRRKQEEGDDLSTDKYKENN